jgi:hypothetical protein
VNEIPKASIADEPHMLTDEERERVAYALGDLVRQVRSGTLGSIPPGMPSQTCRVQPVQGLVVEIVFTRPGPLP